MKKIHVVLIILLSCTFAANSQWSIDSVNMAGIYPYSGVTTYKAVFSNGGEWNVFDAATNVRTLGSLSVNRALLKVVSYNDKVYFGGGKYGYFTDPQYTNKVDVYDAVSNTWSTLTLSKSREVGGAASSGNKVVFAGGSGRTDISGPVYLYKTADIFDATTGVRTIANLSKARSNIAAGASGNKIVFAGGWYWDMNYNVLAASNIDIYDVSTGLWSTATLSKKRENISVAVVGTKIIFAGGTGGNSGGAVTNVDVYDAVSNTWTTSNLPLPRYSMKSVVIGTNAYFAGGANDPSENAIDIYNSLTGTWSTIYLPVSLSGFSMSVINDKIFFAGGYITSTSSYSDLVQIYNPATGTWSTQHLSVPRNYVAALTCANKGFFAGGYVAYGYPVPVATDRVDIYVSSSPIADFSADVTSITAGNTVNFTDLSTNNPTSWVWNFAGGIPSTSTDQSPANIQYNAAGIYDVTLTATNAEGSGMLTKTGYITVTPAPCLIPTGLYAADVTSSSAILNWNAVNGALKYKVSWKASGNNPWTTTTITSTSKVLTGLSANTTYLWKVKTKCSESVSSDFSPNQNFTTTSGRIVISEFNSGLSLYPNPVTDQFSISVPDEMMLPLTCEIHDMFGRKIFEVEINNLLQPVDITDLPAGNYLVRVSDEQNKIWNFQIIKQ